MVAPTEESTCAGDEGVLTSSCRQIERAGPLLRGYGLDAVITNAEATAAWARDPEHRVAKKRGREEWYSHYMIRICKVEREYGRPDE